MGYTVEPGVNDDPQKAVLTDPLDGITGDEESDRYGTPPHPGKEDEARLVGSNGEAHIREAITQSVQSRLMTFLERLHPYTHTSSA